MMKNELEKIISRYMSKSEFFVKTYGEDRELINWVFDYFINKRIISYDSPDMYGQNNNDVLILEHFEFDCTKQSKSGGSEFREDYARIDRNFEKYPPSKVGEGLFHDEVNCTHSSKYYFDNFSASFSTHYEKIKKYKENLTVEKVITELTKKISIGFFVEDVTCLGSSFIDTLDGQWKPLILLLCKQFLDIFEKSNDLDFVLFGFYSDPDYRLWFISKASIDAYRKEQIDLEIVEIIDFTPQVSGYKIPIESGDLCD